MRAVQEDYYLMDRGRIDLLFCKVKVRAWLSQLQDKSWKLARTLKYRNESQVIGDSPTMLFLYYPNAIAESQLYLFHLHRKELLKSFGLTFKALPISVLPRIRVSDPSNLKLIAVQAHFHIEPNDLMDMFDQIKSIGSVAKIIFLDWFATSDLRLFSTIDPFIDRYVKKTVFTDSDKYRTSYFGDTNLMDYYGRLYKCEHRQQQYAVPRSVDDKLVTGVGFISAPYLHSLFSWANFPENERPIDLNARFSTCGSGWYTAMRSAALSKAVALSANYVVSSGSIPKIKYLEELGQSKITFSPFGYGEICWRDYEAMALGSLLIKPDMSHLKVYPDIFIPYETYIPIAWDFSDFDEKVLHYLNNPKERLRITGNAYEVGHEFVRQRSFIEHVKDLV